MEIASVRETANFNDNVKAVTPYTLGQVLDSFATQTYVTNAIAHAVIDPSQIDLSDYAKKTDLPTKLSELTNDDNYVQTVNGFIPSTILPSYVDDVIEASSYSSLPNPGESGKIYVTTDNNKTYRWSGSTYVEISESLALGTTSTTAFRGDYGNTAYQHSQTTGNPHNLSLSDLGLTVSATEINYLYGLDDTVLNKLAAKLNLSGGTLTGFLTLHAAPTQRMHAATKDYVDTEISGLSVTVTQNVTQISEINQDLSGLTTTVGAQADTLTQVQSDITGLNQTTQAHTSAISTINQDITGLSSTVSSTQQTVTVLEQSVNQMDVEFDSPALFILVDDTNKPLSNNTYEINYQCKFRGDNITPDTKSISGTHTGITAAFDSNTNKILFTVNSSTAIPESSNEYTVTYGYTSGSLPYSVTKNIVVVTVPKGEDGSQGTPGPAGKSVSRIQEYYYKSTSPSETTGGVWSSIYPGWSTGYYIWTKTRTLYTDNTYEDSNPIMVTDTTTGWTTIDGIGITNVDVYYYYSTSNTTLSGGSWKTDPSADYDPDKYLWTKSRTTYSNGFADETAPTCISGKGTNGVGVSNNILYFKLVTAGSSAPSAPTDLTPSAQSGWSSTEPAMDLTKDLYATMETIYTDNTFIYSTPQKYSSYEAAKTAQATATTAIQRVPEKSDTPPTDTNKLWLDTVSGKLKQYYGYDPDLQQDVWVIVNDFTANINDLSTQLNGALDNINSDITDLQDAVTTISTLEQKVLDVEQQADALTFDFTTTQQTVIDYGGQLQEFLNNQHSYIRFESGNIILGKDDSDYSLVIKNDSIDICYKGTPLSYWTQNNFNAETVESHNLQLGKFKFIVRDDDSLSFRKVD